VARTPAPRVGQDPALLPRIRSLNVRHDFGEGVVPYPDPGPAWIKFSVTARKAIHLYVPAPPAPGVLGKMSKDWRCLVIDSGTLASPTEQSIVAVAMLGHLWRRRHERQPVLIVADEARNICPQEPAEDLEAAATIHAIKIAGERRKFGLYLLVSTQRPSKIYANVLSQCDSLILMKMNSASDLAYVLQVFSQAPSTFLDQSPHSAQGECLLAGRMVRNPTVGGLRGTLLGRRRDRRAHLLGASSRGPGATQVGWRTRIAWSTDR
jgi:hypothetical protein